MISAHGTGFMISKFIHQVNDRYFNRNMIDYEVVYTLKRTDQKVAGFND